MTKAELKKEAEEYALKQWEGNLPWSVIQKSYYDGALPREKQIQIDAEQIRALQKQKGELTDKVNDLEETIDKLREQLALRYDLEDKIAELKDELKKWKDGIALKDEEIGCIETDFNTFKSEAKEIIKELLSSCFGYNSKTVNYEVKAKAEQFLKEVEE